ncbi:MAG: hypothetical protein FK733_02975 [Asgard group archaeon]|nr:hypothetical protein [Asgard group archaeon]
MSLWRNKINRTILISSIALFLVIIITVVIAINPVVNQDPSIEDPDIPGLNWLKKPWVWVCLIGILMWFIYFNLVLLVGSIREKMNALPGWTEISISALITLLTSIFLGTLANFSQNTDDFPFVEDSLTLLKWVPFMIALGGVVLITLWVLMSHTKREDATAST